MALHSNDRWHGQFTPPVPGCYVFAIEAWTDQYATWRREFLLKHDAGQDVALTAREGHELLIELMPDEREARLVVEAAAASSPTEPIRPSCSTRCSPPPWRRRDDRPDLTRSHVIPLARRARARTRRRLVRDGAAQPEPVPGRHGTFDDCIARVPDIAELGFDVLYFPPIHPIGRTNRKGRNNALNAEPDDPGSLYAIGNEARRPRRHASGARHARRLPPPDRGLRAARHGDRARLRGPVLARPPVAEAASRVVPHRPDGSIKFAENPPKKYEDIVNPDFTCADRIALWEALRDVSCSGSTKACASSASTIRTPSRCRSGNG